MLGDVIAMTNAFDAFEARYRSLAVVTCEWRAFGIDDPEALAEEVFARLRRQRRPPGLKRFYQAVELVVSSAYQRSAGQKSIVESIMAGQIAGLRRAPKTDEDRLRDALRGLRAGDVDILRQACWDGLTPDELAEVNGKTPEAQRERLQAALARFAARLPTDDADPLAVMRDIQPGTHRR